MNPSQVSILINNYNYERYVGAAIESALNQTYPNTEVIVVDDGSTDGSHEVIAGYKDKVTAIFKENGGQASSLNEGFLASKGEIICILDADDVFEGEKIQRIVDIFGEYGAAEWCFHSLRVVDVNTNTLLRINHIDPCGLQDLRQALLRPTFRLPTLSATSGLCFRRSLLEKIMPMPTSRLEKTAIADNYLTILAAAVSIGYLLDESLATMQKHGGNASDRRNSNPSVGAHKAIVTACFLYKKLPSLIHYTNRMFAKGLHLKTLEPMSDTQTSNQQASYWQMATVADKIEILAFKLAYGLLRKQT